LSDCKYCQVVNKKFNFPTVISVNEYLSFPEENVTFELPESDNIVSLFSREEVDDDDSNEAPIISASMALKSLETVRTFLTQQEDSSSYLRLFNSLENFIREKKVNSMKQSSLTQFLANNNCGRLKRHRIKTTFGVFLSPPLKLRNPHILFYYQIIP